MGLLSPRGRLRHPRPGSAGERVPHGRGVLRLARALLRDPRLDARPRLDAPRLAGNGRRLTPVSRPPLRLGFLASGGGTNLQSILDACREGRLRAEPRVVIGNNSGSGALSRARAQGIPARHLSGRTHPDPAALDAAIRDALRGEGRGGGLSRGGT